MSITEITTATDTADTDTATTERTDLLGALAQHRAFLLSTADGLTDDQARHRSTTSALTVGGIIKHVTMTERGWVDFMLDGAEALAPGGEWDYSNYEDEFTMTPDQTLAEIIEEHQASARRTHDVVSALASLDEAQLLPSAPWFPPGATWTMRMVLLHVLAEIAQHAGHADIIRESIDGHRTMG